MKTAVADAPVKSSRNSQPKPLAPTPFKPQRKLFYTLLIIFAGWVVFLAAMYFKTVYPVRHPSL